MRHADYAVKLFCIQANFSRKTNWLITNALTAKCGSDCAEGGEVGMNDRDKAYLLKELTRTIDESDSTAAFCLCQRWILKDALALLKEQKKTLCNEERERNI